jgi:hypothetical protein
MELSPHETELKGTWEFENGRVEGDETEKRIDWLLTHVLKRVASTSGGWQILYTDPNDGRYWEHTFTHSEMQGGGPQRLRLLSEQEAAATYHLDGDIS